MNIFLSIFSMLLVLFTFLPVVKHDNWVFRVFDYPRLQKLVLSISAFVLSCLFLEPGTLKNILLSLMAFNVFYLLYQIYPFTPLGKKQVYKTKKPDRENCISIVIANVYQDNDNVDGCVNEVLSTDADIILLLETNHKWEKGTQSMAQGYPYQVKVPLENTYGMLLFSKLPLEDPSVEYLVEPDIPSIQAIVRLPSGQRMQLYAVHPTPPVPNENPRSTERDKELLLVADKAKESPLPVVVAGDLNDVAWSYTTELFLKMSGLLDPRRGRGFYNTFHAHYPLLRFPLDHAFCSTEFTLNELRRLKNFDSDHFPIFISLQYDHKTTKYQTPMQADAEDKAKAREKKNAVT